MRSLVILALVAVSLQAADQDEALLSAARGGDLEAAKAALGSGADIETKTQYGQTPLYVAAMGGHVAIVEALLAKGAKADVRDTFYKAPALTFVLQRKHFDVAELLITKGGLDPNDHFRGLVSSGSRELVEAVIATGKMTPETLTKSLELALENDKSEIADTLREAGAEPPAPGVEVKAKTLETYTGDYKSAQLPLDIKVSVKNGKLFGQATGQPEFPLKARSQTVFEFSTAGIEMEFDREGGFILRQGGREFPYEKKTEATQ